MSGLSHMLLVRTVEELALNASSHIWLSSWETLRASSFQKISASRNFLTRMLLPTSTPLLRRVAGGSGNDGLRSMSNASAAYFKLLLRTGSSGTGVLE